MAASLCDNIIVMKNGCIVESGTPQQIIENPQNEHTKSLVAAML